ncbi:unnamed protein product [Enterobius vermicularis]|uniref:N(6)-L-threonylcarbamoyladenine synthase n=1 Tax=Enterobius vermicularis TaxID=51028 RepID=A0A0N4V6H2_ENTVE|nr:unnamed protein product [Enterobius vermicularis]
MLTIYSRPSRELWFFRHKFQQFFCSAMSLSSEFLPVLGIETREEYTVCENIVKVSMYSVFSCDDTAVSIVTDRILSSRQFSDRVTQVRLGGICPSVSALQHRNLLPCLIQECLYECNLRLNDLNGIAVTSRPGLVVTLKAGIMQAIGLARRGFLSLVGVHHMQAHATVATLCKNTIRYPFIAFLVSGGHSLISVANGPEKFELYGQSICGSCGECLDKVTRALLRKMNIKEERHFGSVLEDMAGRSRNEGSLKYRITMPSSNGANFDFGSIKSRYLFLLEKLYNQEDFDPESFCASVQHCVAGYLAGRLHNFLEYLSESGKLDSMDRTIVLAGGVASNQYILKMLQLVASFYGFNVFSPPPSLCTDNAVMIAWNGSLLIRNGSRSVYPYENLPITLYAESRSPIGPDMTFLVPRHPRRKLSVKYLAENKVVFYNKSHA